MKPQHDQTTWFWNGPSKITRSRQAGFGELNLDLRFQEGGEDIGNRSRERFMDALEEPKLGRRGLLMAQIERPQSLVVLGLTGTAHTHV